MSKKTKTNKKQRKWSKRYMNKEDGEYNDKKKLQGRKRKLKQSKKKGG